MERSLGLRRRRARPDRRRGHPAGPTGTVAPASRRRRADRDRRHRPARARDGRDRGAATRRAAGTASRRRRSAAARPRGSSRRRRPASPTHRRRSTSPPSPSGGRHALERMELADFTSRALRGVKPAVDAWVATRPLKNANAPLTPFAMPEYRPRRGRTRIDSRRRRCGPPRPARTSSARRTTCSGSSSSRPCSSSPASPRNSGRRRSGASSSASASCPSTAAVARHVPVSVSIRLLRSLVLQRP